MGPARCEDEPLGAQGNAAVTARPIIAYSPRCRVDLGRWRKYDYSWPDRGPEGELRLRCPNCATDNDDGLALCQTCGTLLTSYAGQGVGYVTKETLEKAAKLRIRPPVV